MQEVNLKYPLTSNGEEITTLNMRRPKVKDLLVMQKSNGSDADKELRLFANLCDLAPKDFEEMDLADYEQLQKAYKGFLS